MSLDFLMFMWRDGFSEVPTPPFMLKYSFQPFFNCRSAKNKFSVSIHREIPCYFPPMLLSITTGPPVGTSTVQTFTT